MSTANRYRSYRIEDRAGELCVVFKLHTPIQWIDGSTFDECASTERVLSTRIFLYERSCRDTRLLKLALADLQAAKARPRGLHT